MQLILSYWYSNSQVIFYIWITRVLETVCLSLFRLLEAVNLTACELLTSYLNSQKW